MKNLAKWVRHNQFVAVSLIAIAGVMVWTYGCQSKVSSMLEPAKMVNREELNIEIDAEHRRLEAELENLVQRADLKQTELTRQDAIKQKLINFAAITVDAGTVNPAGVVGLAFSILGVGAVIDNRLKDKVIKNRPLPAPVGTSTG